MANLDSITNDLASVNKMLDEILEKQDRVLANQEALQPRAAQLLRAPERSEQDGGLTLRLIHMVNFLGNVIVDSFGKGYIAENDLNQANDYLDYVIPLLPPS